MKAIVFDLDDTLYPERRYAFSGFAVVADLFCDRLGDATRSAAEMVGLFDTEHRPRVFNELLAQRNLSHDVPLLDRMIEAFRRHHPNIAFHADARSALARLRRGYQLGLITDGSTVQQSRKVAALDLESRVHEIILTAGLGEGFGKPHPRSFELMSTRLDVPHHECVYVGDNPAKDFAGPNALGWTTVQILRPDGIYRDAPTVAGGAPQSIIHSLDELDALVT